MDYREAAAFLRAHDNYLILTHKRPDGDTIGCAAALCRALREVGKTAYVLSNPEVTATFAVYFDGITAPEDFLPDTVAAMDIAALGLLPDNAKQYSDRIDLAVDHHPSQEFFARATCLNEYAAACGVVMYQIIKFLVGFTGFTPDITEALYVAVATDCGCFQYANTDSDAHLVAADLMMKRGFDAAPVNRRLFRTKSLRRLKLEGLIIQNLELYQNGTIAAAPVSRAMMAEAGVTIDDLDDLAAFVGQIQGVLHSMTVRELDNGTCKVSLRTNAKLLNATNVCAKLGGGGHAAASGCTVEGTLRETIDKMMAAIEEVQGEAVQHSAENR